MPQPGRALVFCALWLLLAGCAPRLPGLASAVLPVSAQADLPAFEREGMASWYGPGFAGRLTANGEIFDPAQLTAAHKTLPFNTHVRVINLANDRSVVVRINDRGPFKGARIIDLSRAAAERIGMIGSGTTRVRLEPVNGIGGIVPTAALASLPRYDVIARERRPGELLLLSSDSGGPVLVRVVGNVVPTAAGADVLVSPALFRTLGPSVTIESAR